MTRYVLIACAVMWVLPADRAAAAPATTSPATGPATNPAAVPPGRHATAPLRPFTAFAWRFPGPMPRVKGLYGVGRQISPAVAAQTTKRMPNGARVLLMIDLVEDLLHHPQDVCRGPDGRPTREMGVWPTAGTRAVAERVDAYLGQMAAAGGAVDMLCLDFEDNYSGWAGAMTDARLAAVGADPRFPALADRLGFADARLARHGRGTAGEYLRWNAVMADVVSTALNRAAYDPLRRHFPQAGMCNFDAVAMARDRVVPDLNGHPQYTLGDPPGTHQSPVYYGLWSPGTVAADWASPFVRVVYAANYARATAASTRMPALPWVGFKGYATEGGRPIPWAGTDYWAEGVWHAMLGGGTDNVLYFNPAEPRRVGDPPRGATAADDDAMEAALADLERQAGGHRVVAPVPADPAAWDAGYVVTSARLADGSTLARVTFGERAGHADLRIGGGAVRVHRPVGKVGAWVRVPAN